MTTPKRRYIDELEDGIRFSGGGPVSISLETAGRLESLYSAVTEEYWLEGNEMTRSAHNALDEEMPEPKP